MKQAFYGSLVEKLEAACGIAPSDVVVTFRGRIARIGRSGSTRSIPYRRATLDCLKPLELGFIPRNPAAGPL